MPGTWEWPDGTTLSYSAWGSGQPSNAADRKAMIRLALPSMGYNDMPTDYVTNPICEINKNN